MLADSHCHLNYKGLAEEQQAALERARRSSGSGRRSSRPLEWSGGDGALHSSNSFAASTQDGSPPQPSNGSRNGSPRPSKAVHEVHL